MTLEEIQGKLDLLLANFEELARIPQGSYEEFAADFRNLPAALHLLQTSIEGLIDVAAYTLARRGLPVPTTSRDILVQLETAGLLPAGSTDRFGGMIGFRNRVVHLYDRIDARRVYQVLRDERGDLRTLMDLLLAAWGRGA